MNEGSGYALTNSITSGSALGPAYLGDSSSSGPNMNSANAPSWLSPVSKLHNMKLI